MRYIIMPGKKLSKINREIYGSFSEHLGRCVYDGLFVGKGSDIPNENGVRSDLIAAFQKIKLPVMRWPGGCFADEYHWLDGIGPVESRKKMYNSNWGGVVEDNSFGTHEFLELCRQTGCEPYINGNVGSGTVQEMHDWVEYINSPQGSPMARLRAENGREQPWSMKYFAVGNENWGCGGNMTPEFYADNYRRYQTYIRNYTDRPVYKIACGPNSADYNWTRVLMEKAAGMMDGLSLHYYTVPGPWDHKGSATVFGEDEYYKTVALAYNMERLVSGHDGVMNMYDPEKRVGLIVDEWGTWFDVEPGTNPHFLYQQNTMRDAMVAALTLNIFNKHSDRVKLATIAQTINVLQSLALTDGKNMVLTPTYHVFDLWQGHQDAELVESAIISDTFVSAGLRTPYVSESASVSADGTVTSTLCNVSATEPQKLELRVDGISVSEIEGRILAQKIDAYNDFNAPETVASAPFAVDSVEKCANGTEIALTLPPCSAVSLRMGR